MSQNGRLVPLKVMYENVLADAPVVDPPETNRSQNVNTCLRLFFVLFLVILVYILFYIEII